MYPIAEKLPNELERASFVEALALIGTDQQDEFYAFCEIGKLLSGFSKTMVSLIDSSHQCILSGISPDPNVDRSWPVENSLCQHVIGEIKPTIVYDISDHPIFGRHPKVKSGEMKGSYCGFPIRTSDNLVLGTYCLGNDEPQNISEEVVSAIDKMVTKLGAYIQRQSQIQKDNATKLLFGLKEIQNLNSEISINDLICIIEFRNGSNLNDQDLQALKNLQLVSDNGRLTNKGALALEKLQLYDQSFKSKKLDFSNSSKDFDALFEDL